jgi:hypothetical protein
VLCCFGRQAVWQLPNDSYPFLNNLAACGHPKDHASHGFLRQTQFYRATGYLNVVPGFNGPSGHIKEGNFNLSGL